MTRAGLVTCVLATGLSIGSVAPAVAEDQAVGLSRDGTRWTDSLTDPLFDPDVRWVPGDVRTARFYVRNQHPDRGDLTVDVERVRRDQLLETGWLEVSARAGSRPWTSVAAGGLQELLDTDDLVSGEPVAVEVRVRMSEEAPNGTMVLSTDLDLRITLVDSRAGDGPDTGATLPDTGSTLVPWLPPLAVALLGTGTWLVVRRRDDEDDPAPVGLTGS